MEVRLKDDNTDFINVLSEMPGVQSAVLVSYNGDYMGQEALYVNAQKYKYNLRCCSSFFHYRDRFIYEWRTSWY